jgi:arginase
MGPSALRIAGLCDRLIRLGYDVTDTGDVAVRIPESADAGSERARFRDEIADTNRALAERVAASLEAGALPIVLGGDHSLSIGSIAGAASWAAREGDDLGLLWFDAHADMNTSDTTISGNIHGMGLAGEREVVHESGIRVFTMREIDEKGIVPVLEEALAIVRQGTLGFHVSWDMDFVDPNYAPGVGTPVIGGVNYREGHLALELVSDGGGMVSMDCVETNPILDDRNRTGALGVELILSALGKSIL